MWAQETHTLQNGVYTAKSIVYCTCTCIIKMSSAGVTNIYCCYCEVAGCVTKSMPVQNKTTSQHLSRAYLRGGGGSGGSNPP